MRTRSSLVLSLLLLAAGLLAALCLAGCGSVGGGTATDKAASVFELDSTKAIDVKVGAKGAGGVVGSGTGKAAIWVHGGAAPDGNWKLTPIAKAPAGVKGILVPGMYVDTAGAEPSGTCSIGFLYPADLPEGATVVKYADDGKSWTAVPSVIVTASASRIVVAEVDGFSAYGLGDGGAGAGAGAGTDNGSGSGPQVDWTMKVIGSETQEAEGWKFTYDLDFFASGGGVGQGGTYKGHGTIVMVGAYDKTFGGIIKGLGDIKATARDDSLTFTVVDAPLADLLTGNDVNSDDGVLRGSGIFRGRTEGTFAISATGPNVAGKYDDTANGDSPIPFKIEFAGEDAKVEIDKMGIFGGKVLRTEK
jgi:hypothetical protein